MELLTFFNIGYLNNQTLGFPKLSVILIGVFHVEIILNYCEFLDAIKP